MKRTAIIALSMTWAAYTQAQEPGPACMDYMAADKAYAEGAARALIAYEEALTPSREASQKIRQRADTEYREAKEAASAKYAEDEVVAANTRFQNEMDAENSYNKTVHMADATFEEAVAPYRKASETASIAYKTARDKHRPNSSAIKRASATASRASSRLGSMESQARKNHKRALRRSEDALKQDMTNIRNLYKKTLEPLDAIYQGAMNHAEKLRQETLQRADTTDQVAQEQANNVYQTTMNSTELQWTEAYLQAFRYPAKDWERDVAGYDDEIVLKMAVHEREIHCPEWQ